MSLCLSPWLVYLQPLFLSLLVKDQRVNSMKAAVVEPLQGPMDQAESLANN